MSETTKWSGELPLELQPTEDDSEQLARFAKFLDSCRGDEAIEALQATDFRVRAFCAAREEAFHRIGLVVREYRALLSRAASPAPGSGEAVENEEFLLESDAQAQAVLASPEPYYTFEASDIFGLARAYLALRAAPVPPVVTEAMVEAAARVMYPIEDQSLSRQLARRELLRNALTAALEARRVG